jgi:hypothetical protein
MGNWKRVKIEGSCSAADVKTLRDALTMGKDYSNFHCLVHTGGIAGLPNWAGETIDAVGNLAERGYDQDDIEEVLLEIAAVAPSLAVKVHVGDDNESDRCVATVVLSGQRVEIVEPEIETIPEMSQDQMHRNLLSQLMR